MIGCVPLEANSNPQTVNPEWVVSSTFLAMNLYQTQIIGMVDIRHSLNEFLRSYGGHIGYGVRPSERNKGYATQILRLALSYSKSINLNQIMVACYAENLPSKKVILKNGGLLQRTFTHTDGKLVHVYWISN